MGFRPVARHRSREVLLYRQGGMNIVVNAHPGAVRVDATGQPVTALGAMALRVRDAGEAYRRAIELGAWEVPTRAAAMELNIPGIHGVGDSRIYFVDRYRDFSIYDVDFMPIARGRSRPAGAGRTCTASASCRLHPGSGPHGDWLEFYRQLFGFSVLPSGRYFGILPKGTLLESPCRKFYLQLIEPPAADGDVEWEEGLLRIGLGAPDVPAACGRCRRAAIVFVDRGSMRPTDAGAAHPALSWAASRSSWCTSHLSTAPA